MNIWQPDPSVERVDDDHRPRLRSTPDDPQCHVDHLPVVVPGNQVEPG